MANEPLRRGLKAPRQRTYQHAKHGQSAPRSGMNNLILLPDSRARIYRPDFKVGKTVFRPYPGFCPENPEAYDAYRLPNGDIGSFLRTLYVASYWGLEKGQRKTFIVYNQVDRDTKGYDPSTNPAVLWQDRVRALAKKKNIENRQLRLLKADAVDLTDGKDAPLRPIQTIALMQGLLFERGNDFYLKRGYPLGGGQDDPPILLEITGATSKRMLEQLDQIKEGYDGPEDDFEAKFEHGDPVSLATGRFIVLQNEGLVGTQGGEDGEVTEGAWDTSHQRQRRTDDSGEAFLGYAVDIAETYRYGNKVYKAKLLAQEAMVRSHTVWIEDHLNFLSHDEICLLLVHAFPGHRQMFEYAWKDHPEFFTEPVLNVLKQSVSAPVGDIPTDDDEPAWGGETVEDEEAPMQPRGRAAAPSDDENDFSNEPDDELTAADALAQEGYEEGDAAEAPASVAEAVEAAGDEEDAAWESGEAAEPGDEEEAAEWGEDLPPPEESEDAPGVPEDTAVDPEYAAPAAEETPAETEEPLSAADLESLDQTQQQMDEMLASADRLKKQREEAAKAAKTAAKSATPAPAARTRVSGKTSTSLAASAPKGAGKETSGGKTPPAAGKSPAGKTSGKPTPPTRK